MTRSLFTKQLFLINYNLCFTMDESEIPIDIHTNKLLEWLISRRHVPKDWSNGIMKIREKINNAIQDMPEHKEITNLLSGTYINYYHCKSIINVLKETESSSKNVFGQYSSQRFKDWLEIIKLYEKDNIYLGEVASLLLRNVNYEVPALKKNISKNNTAQNELEKRETEYEKSYNMTKVDFNSTCKSLGIKGKNIKNELLVKSTELPELNQKIVKNLKILMDSVEFYQRVVKDVCHQSRIVFPLFRFLLEKGETTVYEWKYKTPPSSIMLPDGVNITDSGEQDVGVADDVIDFGADETIDFNCEDENIDWGITAEDGEDGSNQQQGSGIDITVEDETVARGDEARSILGNVTTRNQLVNELMELEAFLKLRHYEMSSNYEILSLPEALSLHDEPTLSNWLQSVQNILKQIQNPTSLHYLNITTNRRYVDQLTDKLTLKLMTMEKMMAAKKSVQERKKELIKETKNIQPKISLLIENTRNLQELIEEDISKRYNGRPVNLIGGVNLL